MALKSNNYIENQSLKSGPSYKNVNQLKISRGHRDSTDSPQKKTSLNKKSMHITDNLDNR